MNKRKKLLLSVLFILVTGFFLLKTDNSALGFDAESSTFDLPLCSFSASPGIWAKPKDCSWSTKTLLGSGSMTQCNTLLILQHVTQTASGSGGWVYTIGPAGVGEGTSFCKVEPVPLNILPECPFSGTPGDVWVKPNFTFNSPIFNWSWEWSAGRCKIGEECARKNSIDFQSILLKLGLITQEDINLGKKISIDTSQFGLPFGVIEIDLSLPVHFTIGPELYTHAGADTAWCGTKIPPLFTGASPCNLCVVKGQAPTPTQYTLDVSKTGTGSGTVISSPSGINCGTNCSQAFSSGTTVTLTATPSSGSTFSGWSGACSGQSICTLTMNSNKLVTAIFQSSTPIITCQDTDGGKNYTTQGMVTVGEGGEWDYCLDSQRLAEFYCQSNTIKVEEYNCYSHGYQRCQNGACQGQAPTPTQYTLDVSKTGTGSGTVISSPSGINCGTNCSQAFSSGTTVTLTATPSSGSTFSGWSGACSGQSICTLTMNSNKLVTAIFQSSTPIITCQDTDGGKNYEVQGIVTVDGSSKTDYCLCPASGCKTLREYYCQGNEMKYEDYNCPSACQNGACIGETPSTYTLSVSKTGAGSGTVESNPYGIICGTNCSYQYTEGETIRLTAIPDSGSVFSGWTGECTRSASCTENSCDVIMNSNKLVTAKFDSATPPPSVCSGTLSLSLSPDIVSTSGHFTAILSGLQNCDGKIATVTVEDPGCVGSCRKNECDCQVMGSGCSCTLTAPSQEGTFTCRAKVDNKTASAQLDVVSSIGNDPVHPLEFTVPSTITSGKVFDLKVSGEDKNGVYKLYYTKCTQDGCEKWVSYDCQSSSNCSYIWSLKETTPGSYWFYAGLYGLKPDGSKEWAYVNNGKPVYSRVTSEPSSTFSGEDPAKCTEFTLPSTITSGKAFDLKVSGEDKNGVYKLYYTKCTQDGCEKWVSYDCQGSSNCSYTWSLKETTPGSYWFYAGLYGLKSNGTGEWIDCNNKNPILLTVTGISE